MSKNLTPLRAIRIYCRQCSGESPKEIKLCPIPDCPLYPYREGRNPKRQGIGGVFHSKKAVETAEITTGKVKT
jgi:hypothetical protein